MDEWKETSQRPVGLPEGWEEAVNFLRYLVRAYKLWLRHREANKCCERAAVLYRFGDPEAAQDQLDMAQAFRNDTILDVERKP